MKIKSLLIIGTLSAIILCFAQGVSGQITLVTSPNAGVFSPNSSGVNIAEASSWYSGETNIIKWTATGSDNVNISYTPVQWGGRYSPSWTPSGQPVTITTNIPESQQYYYWATPSSLNVTNPSIDAYEITVTDANNPTDYAISSPVPIIVQPVNSPSSNWSCASWGQCDANDQQQRSCKYIGSVSGCSGGLYYGVPYAPGGGENVPAACLLPTADAPNVTQTCTNSGNPFVIIKPLSTNNFIQGKTYTITWDAGNLLGVNLAPNSGNINACEFELGISGYPASYIPEGTMNIATHIPESNRSFSWTVPSTMYGYSAQNTAYSNLSLYVVAECPTAQSGSPFSVANYSMPSVNIVSSSGFIPVNNITVTGAAGANSVVVGSGLQMSATVLPANATNPAVTWSVSSGTKDITINPNTGMLEANSLGTVTVVATSADGSKIIGTEQIIVISAAQSAACTASNWTSTLSPTVCPSSGQQTETWTQVGTCSGGVIEPTTQTVNCIYQNPTPACTASNWTYRLFCPSSGAQTRVWTKNGTCSGGVTEPATETVYCNNIITAIKINPAAINLTSIGAAATANIPALFVQDQNGEEINSPNITYVSSNNAVATVNTIKPIFNSSGQLIQEGMGGVASVSFGTANITATYGSLISSPCVVTVAKTVPPATANIVYLSNFNNNSGPQNLYIGTTYQLVLTSDSSGSLPLTASALSTFTWKSDNPSVATVNSSGLVTAVSVGTANITVTSPNYQVDVISITNVRGNDIYGNVPANPFPIVVINICQAKCNNIAGIISSTDCNGNSTNCALGCQLTYNSAKAINGSKCFTTAPQFKIIPQNSTLIMYPWSWVQRGTGTDIPENLNLVDQNGNPILFSNCNWTSSNPRAGAFISDAVVIEAPDHPISNGDYLAAYSTTGNAVNVYPFEPGTTTITASVGGSSASTTLIVSPYIIPSPSFSLSPGQSQQVSVLIRGVVSNCLWKSDKSTVATVDSSGMVKGISLGNTIVHAQCDSLFSVAIPVTVQNSSAPSVTKTSVSASSITITTPTSTSVWAIGKSNYIRWKENGVTNVDVVLTNTADSTTTTLHSKVSASRDYYVWNLSKNLIPGTYTITVSDSNNPATFAVSSPFRVVQRVVGVSVAAANSATSVVIGSTLQMSATVTPANATNPAVIWSISSGAKYATINPSTGVLTPLAVGTVRVKAVSVDLPAIAGSKTIKIIAAPQ